MNDVVETYKLMQQRDEEERRGRASTAVSQYDDCRRMAIEANCGLDVKLCSAAHYQIIRTNASDDIIWIWNVYPSTLRIVADRRHDGGPKLDIPSEWTLRWVVEAVVKECLKGRG